MDVSTELSSADLPSQFNFVTILGLEGEQAVALQDLGENFRIDIYAGGGSQQVGNISWTGPMSLRLGLDIPTGTITATTLSGTITYGDGWTSVEAGGASRTLTPWAWVGDTASFGGLGDMFVFNGAIQNVRLAA